MKEIYRFEGARPPALSERMLLAEIERRRAQKQAALLALAGVFAELCLLAAAFVLQPVNGLLSIACAAYVCAAVIGSGAIAIVFTHRRGNLIWPSQS